MLRSPLWSHYVCVSNNVCQPFELIQTVSAKMSLSRLGPTSIVLLSSIVMRLFFSHSAIAAATTKSGESVEIATLLLRMQTIDMNLCLFIDK